MTMTTPLEPAHEPADDQAPRAVHPAAAHSAVERGATPRLRGRVARELVYTLVDLPLAILGFTYVVVAISTGSALAVTFLGLPLLAAMLQGARRLGAAQRGLAGKLLGERVPAPMRFRPRRPGALGWIFSGLGDGAGWRAFCYLLVKFPLAIINVVVAVTLWAYGLGALSYPIWRRYLPLQHDSHGVAHRGESFNSTFFIDTWPRMGAQMAVGVVLLLLAVPAVRGLVALDRMLIRGLLGPTRRSIAAARMRELEHTRAAAVDDAAAALRRIERDLHDGAQARLVGMAMNLGIVRERLATGGENVDLDETRELVDAAHRDVKEALVELRDLARGIHPPILDHGLEAALASLTARGPLPVQVRVDLPNRPSAAIETIAYFCCAELLTNTAKHAHATEAQVGIVGRAGRIRITVSDNGCGGADPSAGSGLAGLVERIRTVDGWLDVVSPAGGPTRITIDLPLHA